MKVYSGPRRLHTGRVAQFSQRAKVEQQAGERLHVQGGSSSMVQEVPLTNMRSRSLPDRLNARLEPRYPPLNDLGVDFMDGTRLIQLVVSPNLLISLPPPPTADLSTSFAGSPHIDLTRPVQYQPQPSRPALRKCTKSTR